MSDYAEAEVMSDEKVRVDQEITGGALARRVHAAVVAPPGPAEWSALKDQAAELARSGLVPSRYTGKPQDILVVALAARELGIPPIVALNKMHVIDGTPGLSAEVMAGLVQREGHELWLEHSDEKAAVVAAKRRGQERVHQQEFTIHDAETAGLLDIWYERWVPKDMGNRSKNVRETYVVAPRSRVEYLIEARQQPEEAPDWVADQQGRGETPKRRENWFLYPKAMLRARAITALCRVVFADVMMGYTYSPEELGAAVDEDGNVVQADAYVRTEGHPTWVGKLIEEGITEEQITEEAQVMLQEKNSSRTIAGIADVYEAPLDFRVELARRLRAKAQPETAVETAAPTPAPEPEKSATKAEGPRPLPDADHCSEHDEKVAGCTNCEWSGSALKDKGK